MAKIKKGDQVIVISGKDKKKTGEVTRVCPKEELVLVAGVNMVLKSVKANPQKNITGGLIQKEAFLRVSKVAIYNPNTQKADRIGFKIEDGKKVRVFKSSGEPIGR